MSNAQLDDITRTNNLVHASVLAREQLQLATEIVGARWPNLGADAQANATATVANTIAVNFASRVSEQTAAQHAAVHKK
jgi:hypothetical protein